MCGHKTCARGHLGSKDCSGASGWTGPQGSYSLVLVSCPCLLRFKMFSFQSPFEKGVSKPQVSQGFKVLGFWRLTTSLADAGFLCLTPMGGFGALKGPLRGCELP